MDKKQSLMQRLKEALIRSVGDSRTCPYCQKSFVPKDRTAEEALNIYRELFNKE